LRMPGEQQVVQPVSTTRACCTPGTTTSALHVISTSRALDA
jgi:hypothetical protein